jgi:hypothetical protein
MPRISFNVAFTLEEYFMFLKKDTPENALGTAVAVLWDEATDKIILSLNERTAAPHWRLLGGRIKSRDIDRERPFDGRLAAHNAIRNVIKHVLGLSIKLHFVAENKRVRSGGLYVFTGLILRGMPVQPMNGELIQFQGFSPEEIRSSDLTQQTCRESIEEALAWKG